MAISPFRQHIQHLAGGIETKRKFIKPLTSHRTYYLWWEHISQQAPTLHTAFLPRCSSLIQFPSSFSHYPHSPPPPPPPTEPLSINNSQPPPHTTLALCKYCWQEKIFRKLIFHNSTIDMKAIYIDILGKQDDANEQQEMYDDDTTITI